jgi:hypothetical protein
MQATNTTKPATTRNTAQVQGVWLKPEVVANETEALDVALDGVRRRPVLAAKPDGTQVVCCSRTARKHGWQVLGRMFAK